jgi:DNA-directed RNA polymerase specialized sigma24 family protein
MDELQTAREWLARTETRLEEVSREAQEQVKLLGSLMKNENSGKKAEKGQGAPSLSARDMVIKLAHQGWKVEEISKAVQVSRGEVELILELAGKQ